MLTNDQLALFQDQGYLRLGRLLTSEELSALQQRIDDLMMGRLPNERFYFQLDSETGEYGDVPSGGAWAGPTLKYRKIQELQRDDLFMAYMRHPYFRALTRQLIGENVAIYRAMFMNKPAHAGTILPYHQDAGTQWGLTKDPEITVWTALDPATVANGCVQIIPGSHKLGLLSERGHTITPQQEAEHCPDERAVYLEADAGEAILLHNLVLHRSGINRTAIPRRAFSVCYMDASIRLIDAPHESFPLIFGAPPAA